MPDVIRLLVTLVVIVGLIRFKLKIGLVMMAASAALAAMYLMRPADALATIGHALVDPATIKLLSALILIRMLEVMLREHDMLSRMMDGFKSAFRSRKAVIVSMPLLIGMLPSVGGAYFSAPMVDEATKGIEMSQDEKGFVNYWFRHIWEFILPLYPGILLVVAITGVQLRAIMLANLPYALVMLVLGFALSMRGIGPDKTSDGQAVRGLGPEILRAFIPIAAILVMVIAFGIKLYIAMAVVVAGMFVRYRYGGRKILEIFRYGISMDAVLLITGVMLFKTTMGNTGAVDNISAYFTSLGIPLLPVLFVLPFFVGILTGLTIGYVGAAFPLLISLPGGDTLGALSFAFAAGFAGVLLSPVHVCLVLTREYFDASMPLIYKRMVWPTAVIIGVAAVEYFVLLRFF